jgi:hypothetical protein
MCFLPPHIPFLPLRCAQKSVLATLTPTLSTGRNSPSWTRPPQEELERSVLVAQITNSYSWKTCLVGDAPGVPFYIRLYTSALRKANIYENTFIRCSSTCPRRLGQERRALWVGASPARLSAITPTLIACASIILSSSSSLSYPYPT